MTCLKSWITFWQGQNHSYTLISHILHQLDYLLRHHDCMTLMVVCPDCGWPNYSWWFWPYVTQNILAIIFVSLQKLHVILQLKHISSAKKKQQQQYTVTSLQRTGILILKPVHNQVTVWPSGSCTFSQRPDRGGIRKTISSCLSPCANVSSKSWQQYIDNRT